MAFMGEFIFGQPKRGVVIRLEGRARKSALTIWDASSRVLVRCIRTACLPLFRIVPRLTKLLFGFLLNWFSKWSPVGKKDMMSFMLDAWSEKERHDSNNGPPRLYVLSRIALSDWNWHSRRYRRFSLDWPKGVRSVSLYERAQPVCSRQVGSASGRRRSNMREPRLVRQRIRSKKWFAFRSMDHVVFAQTAQAGERICVLAVGGKCRRHDGCPIMVYAFNGCRLGVIVGRDASLQWGDDDTWHH